MAGWDPTPRYPNTRPSKGDTEQCDLTAAAFLNATRARMHAAMCESGGGRQMFSIFAWNEWGEGESMQRLLLLTAGSGGTRTVLVLRWLQTFHPGAVLEPDTADGLGMIQALKAARFEAEQQYAQDLVAGRCQPSNAVYWGSHVFAVNGGKTPLP